MQPDFWLERWRLNQIAFHQSAVHPKLEEFWPALALPAHSRVLVPLCGKSLDLLWLLEQGFVVVAVELAEMACESFCMEHGIPARRRQKGSLSIYEADNLQLFCGDFFDLTPELVQPLSGVYDRAAFISWSPQLRPRYVEQLRRLTSTGTQTLLITMDYEQSQMNGPPFAVPPATVKQFYAPAHTIRMLDDQDILAAEPRLQARGLSALHEACYQLTRI